MIAIGVMTDSTFDGVRAVMTEFRGSQISDVASVFMSYSKELRDKIVLLQKEVVNNRSYLSSLSKTKIFKEALDLYSAVVIEAVQNLIDKASISKKSIAVVGISGMSLGENYSPFLKCKPFTTQIFDAERVAKALRIPVVYDVYSDAILNTAQNISLQSQHFLHLCAVLEKNRFFPVCFINGVDTAHISVVSHGDTIQREVFEFDCGAFDYYPSRVREGLFDSVNGEQDFINNQGDISLPLLDILYNKSSVTSKGENFYDINPPKVADVLSYNLGDFLVNYSLRREDILRTVEYMAAYSTFMNLRFVPENIDFPVCFIAYGKGWKNQVIYRDFKSLLSGRGVVLPQHQEIFKNILSQIKNKNIFFGLTGDFGIDEEYMGARIMADIARYTVKGKEYFKGCKCGLLCNYKDAVMSGRGYTFSRAAKGWRLK